MRFSKYDDLLLEVAKEMRMPVEKVQFIENEFWRILRTFLTDPIRSKCSIKLKGFIRFQVKKSKLERVKDRLSDQSLKILEYLNEQQQEKGDDESGDQGEVLRQGRDEKGLCP